VENLDDISKAVTFAARNESRYEKKSSSGERKKASPEKGDQKIHHYS
jgi:hypothetical protein